MPQATPNYTESAARDWQNLLQSRPGEVLGIGESSDVGSARQQILARLALLPMRAVHGILSLPERLQQMQEDYRRAERGEIELGNVDFSPIAEGALLTVGATPFGRFTPGPGKVLGAGPTTTVDAMIKAIEDALGPALKKYGTVSDLQLAQNLAKKGQWSDLAKLHETSSDPAVGNYIDTLPSAAKNSFYKALGDVQSAPQAALPDGLKPFSPHPDYAKGLKNVNDLDYIKSDLYGLTQLNPSHKGWASLSNKFNEGKVNIGDVNTAKAIIKDNEYLLEMPQSKAVAILAKSSPSAWKAGEPLLSDEALANAGMRRPDPTPLPAVRDFLPQAERERRAALGGFTTDVYHGDWGEPWTHQKLDPKAGGYAGFHVSGQPELADLYAHIPEEIAKREVEPTASMYPPQNAQIVPLKLNTQNYQAVDAGGELWAGRGGDLMRHAIKQAQKEGKDGVIIRNIFDEPAGDTKHLGAPKDVYIVLNPTTARSRFADFDPSKFHLNDLLASGAGFALPAGVAAQLYRAPDGRVRNVTPVDYDPFAEDRM